MTELRQNECKHLAIENIAPEIFHKLLSRLALLKAGNIYMHGAVGHLSQLHDFRYQVVQSGLIIEDR